MITSAQYKVLKAWPDELPAIVSGDLSPDDGFLFLSVGEDLNPLSNYKTFESLYRDALIVGTHSNKTPFTYSKVHPACDAAIREYEAAYNIKSNSKEI